jgi:hypothetical protein
MRPGFEMSRVLFLLLSPVHPGFPVPHVNSDNVWSGKKSHAQTAARPLYIVLEGSHYTVTATAVHYARKSN